MPQSVNCPLPAQHQTGETPLGWVNKKLCAFIQTFSPCSVHSLVCLALHPEWWSKMLCADMLQVMYRAHMQ